MDYSANRILVCFRSNVSRQQCRQIHKQMGAKKIDKIKELNVHIVTVKPDRIKTCLCGYSTCSEVKYVERDGLAKATIKPNAFIPNDPLIIDQWGLLKIQAPQAWSEIPKEILDPDPNLKSKPKPIVVAVLDTGMDPKHPDLSKKIVLNKNFSDSPTVDDFFGHGTHVGGIIGAITNNRTGIASVTVNAVKLMNVKVLGDDGSGSFSAVAQGIIFAADYGAKVINMSLGGTFKSKTAQRAVQYAAKRGVTLVASAGNGSTTEINYPAGFSEVISVAATDQNDRKASFSSFGASWVDVAAPGVSIVSTLPTHPSFIGQNYGILSGTSQAAPFVSGLAGLILAVNPKPKRSVRNIIELTTDKVRGVGTLYKFGRINAFKAIKLAVRK